MSAAPSLVIDGVEVPERLIAQEIGHHPAPSLAEARTAAARALAIRALLLDRARRLAIEAQPEVDEDGREETGDEALIRALLEQEVRPAEPDAEERRRFYDARPDRFMTPPLIEASHILIQPAEETLDAWEAARAAAQSVVNHLAARPGDFAEIAQGLSQCPSREAGGALGQLSPGDLAPEVETALDALSPGMTSTEPTRSRFGWHVLRLDRRSPGRRLPFEHVEADIADHLRQRSWAGAAARYVAELAEQARETGVALTMDETGEVSAGALSFGDLLADGVAVAARAERWLDGADPELATLARAEAGRHGLSMAAYVRQTLAAHVAGADDEGWTRLISAAQGAEDPALACVRAILRQALVPPAKTFTLIRRR